MNKDLKTQIKRDYVKVLKEYTDLAQNQLSLISDEIWFWKKEVVKEIENGNIEYLDYFKSALEEIKEETEEAQSFAESAVDYIDGILWNIEYENYEELNEK